MKENISIIKWLIYAAVVFCIFIGYSIWNFAQYRNEEKSKDFEQYAAALSDSLEAEVIPIEQIDPSLILDTTRQKILLIGDSMAEGLKLPLKQYFDYNGHQIEQISKTSATIMYWVGKDSTGKLRQQIEAKKPSYLMICLGSNELFTKGLEQYEQYLKNIINQAQGLPIIWIGPPNWKPDNGLTKLIAETLGEKRYFPSDKMKLPRAGDGIHPTYNGYQIWADSIAVWIQEHSRHKILLEKPLPPSAADSSRQDSNAIQASLKKQTS